MPRRNKSIKHIIRLMDTNCYSKRQFQSEYMAREAAEYQMLINPSLELSVYQCDLCHKWHLTRRNIQ